MEEPPRQRPLDDRDRAIEEILNLNRETIRLTHGGNPRDWLYLMDITMPQLKTLLVLYAMQQASMGELADALGTGVSTVTGIVDRLVDHGLVTREEAPHDRRVVVGRLTPRGAALIDRLYLTARDRLGRVLSRLSLEELDLVVQASRALNRAARHVFEDTVGERRSSSQPG